MDIAHPHFRDPGVLEITKLVVDRRARARRVALGMLFVASLIARILGKPHLWQVSRDTPSDMSWRTGLGFDYSIRCRFHDPDLNQMPSQVGYLYLPTVTQNMQVPFSSGRFIGRLLRRSSRRHARETGTGAPAIPSRGPPDESVRAALPRSPVSRVGRKTCRASPPSGRLTEPGKARVLLRQWHVSIGLSQSARVTIRLDEDRGIPFGTRVGHRGPDACPHSLTRGAGKSFAAHYRLTQSSHQILNSFEVLGPAFCLAIGKQL